MPALYFSVVFFAGRTLAQLLDEAFGVLRILLNVLTFESPSGSLQAVLCFSHLRWNFVYQRPQHLLTRCLKHGPVHFWEEPVFEDCQASHLQRSVTETGVHVLTPVLPHGIGDERALSAQRSLLNAYLTEQKLDRYVAWYYTPMAMRFTAHLTPEVIVYDCMDELSAFQGAPPELIQMEQRLFARADVVFSGGASLYASKKTQHANVHLFPSSIDREHFAAARSPQPDPADQAGILHPRVGFYGVLDERLDRDLLRDVAAAQPDWNFVLIGPVVKIREEDLPRAANIYYLGQKSYADLPQYLANWEVAMLPFAQNASTRFISPTKTPEYLAAGRPAVSTPIQDVVKPYGDQGLVKIATNPAEFGKAIVAAFQERTPAWLASVDRFLAGNSWDKTFEGMWKQVEQCRLAASGSSAAQQEQRSVLHV